MDNIRFAFICALGAAIFLLWQAWQDDYGQTAVTPSAQQTVSVEQQSPDPAKDSVVPDIASAPGTTGQDEQDSVVPSPDEPDSKVASSSQKAASTTAAKDAETIHVVTDKFDIVISADGGDIRELALRDIAQAGGDPATSLQLLNDSLPNFFVTQSGLVSADRNAPDHRDSYDTPHDEYRLSKGESVLRVPLTWTSDDGRVVTKIYTFHRGSYQIGLRYEVQNKSGKPWTISAYMRFWRVPYQHGNQAPFAGNFNGVGLYKTVDQGQEYTYQTFDVEALNAKNLNGQQSGGWIAMVQHYFLGAVIPGDKAKVNYFAKPKPVPGAQGKGYVSGYIGARRTVEPKTSVTLNSTLFIGPKLQDKLDDVAPGLGLTVDYGIFTIFAGPIFWVLEKLYSLVGNWGVAIILLTVIIKLLFYKLSETQYRSMARMRKFAPRMKQLKEQYGDDKQKLQQKMMELYKKEGFNPLGGCWPMLVQMPVFIALYWVLRASVELRNADFMLWINDLSSPDPWYIFPALFGITMFIQQRMSSTNMSMDPMQERMMQIMPIGLAIFFCFFPAGLVLYWLTNNLLSIAQQWYIYRKFDHESDGNKAKAN